jgi:hypothetical protein
VPLENLVEQDSVDESAQADAQEQARQQGWARSHAAVLPNAQGGHTIGRITRRGVSAFPLAGDLRRYLAWTDVDLDGGAVVEPRGRAERRAGSGRRSEGAVWRPPIYAPLIVEALAAAVVAGVLILIIGGLFIFRKAEKREAQKEPRPVDFKDSGDKQVAAEDDERH